jgi:GTPase SAR1 family protein
LRDNLLTWLPPNISNLSNIVSLDLSANHLETLPKPIGSLTSLRHLILARNKLNRMPPSFRNLNTLETLDLSFNMFNNLPRATIAGLSSLELLNISNNQIVMLPPAVSKLVNLRTLNLNSNQLEHLPNEMDALSKLEFLKLGRNRFHTLPDVVCKCISLTKLEASENYIDELPLNISLLQNLKILDLYANLLTTLPASVGMLKSLHTLTLKANKLKELPLTLCLLRELETLELVGNNDLNVPPEKIVSGGVNSVLDFLRKELDMTSTIHSIRMLVLGKENVGKTSLVKALKGELSMKEKIKSWSVPATPSVPRRRRGSVPKQTLLSTDGIEQSILTFIASESVSKSSGTLGPRRAESQLTPPTDSSQHKRRSSWHRPNSSKSSKPTGVTVDVNILDFAGQQAYYSTHQLFLTSESSLHVVVFDMTDLQCDQNVEFWLQSIYCAVPAAHVVCVGTHLDGIEKSRDEIGRWLEEKRLTLRKTFPTFSTFRFAAVSLLSGENFDVLRRDLEHVITSRTPVKSTVPRKYLVLNDLFSFIALKMEPPIITRFELEKYARVCDLKSPQEIISAAKFLHNLGTIMFFASDGYLGRASPFSLRVSSSFSTRSLSLDMAILSPHWLMKIVSTLFSTSHSFARDGVLKHSDLVFLWQSYPKTLFGHFLALMERFEIIYQLPNVKTASPSRLSSSGHRKLNPQRALDIMHGRAPLWDGVAVDDSDSPVSEEIMSERRNSTSTVNSFAPPSRDGASSSSESLNHGTIKPSYRLSQMLTESPMQEEFTSAWGAWALNGPEFDERAVSLIPALLPTQEPRAVLHSMWYSVSEDSFEQLDRSFRFRFLPPGFMSRLLARLFHHFSPVGYWREGILCKRTSDDAVLVTARPTVGGATSLDVFVRSPTLKASRGLFEAVLGMIDSLMIEWPSLEIYQFCRCPHCIPGSPRTVGGVLPLVDLDTLIPQGATTITCQNGHKVPIDDVAPEMSLAAFGGAILNWNDIKLYEIIGKGAYAAVQRGKWKNQAVACKVLKLDCVTKTTNPAKFREFRAEVNALRLSIARQMAAALRHLHSQEPEPLAHLDFKSPNIMLQFPEKEDTPSQQVTVKIIDFGLTTRVGPRKLRGRRVDNPVWVAPEILRNEPYDEKVDIYALGVILYEMISFKQFFSEFSFFSDIEDAVCSGRRPTLPKDCPTMYAQLVQRCWDDNARKRPSFTWIENTLSKIEAAVSRKKPVISSSSANLLRDVRPSSGRSKSYGIFRTSQRLSTAIEAPPTAVPEPVKKKSSKRKMRLLSSSPNVATLPEGRTTPLPPPPPSWFRNPEEKRQSISFDVKDAEFSDHLVQPSPSPSKAESAPSRMDGESSSNTDSQSASQSSDGLRRRPTLIRRIFTFFSKTQLDEVKANVALKEAESGSQPPSSSEASFSHSSSSKRLRSRESPALDAGTAPRLVKEEAAAALKAVPVIVAPSRGLISKSSSDSLASTTNYSDAGSGAERGVLKTIMEEDNDE